MSGWRRVAPEKLKAVCDPNLFPCDTTDGVEPLAEIIGQERAVRAMEFGLSCKGKGYNIFISGITGSGRTTYARKAVTRVAALQPTPGDWVYVYNFKDPDRPVSIPLPPGKAVEFAADMDELVEELRREVPKRFESEDYERRRDALVQAYQQASQSILEELQQFAASKDVAITRTPTGFATLPVLGGKPVPPEEFEKLDARTKEAFTANAREVQQRLADFLRRSRELEKELKSRLKQLDQGLGHALAGALVKELAKKYADNAEIVDYLNGLEQDIVENLSLFLEDENDQDGDRKKISLTRYKVNVLVNNLNTQGAPVVFETNPTYFNLFGRLEYRSVMGALATDFTMIKPGAIHRANGGYLIIQAGDVLKNPFAWDGLKRVLNNGEVRIESMAEQLRTEAIATLHPEPIPVDVKVILIGSPHVYQLLYTYDEDFQKLFKIKAEFDVSMERTPENIRKYASFVRSISERESLKPFTRDALAGIVEYSSRLVEDQERLSTRFNEIVEVIREASAWADLEGKSLVTIAEVKKALEEKVYRSNLVEKRLLDMVARGQILIDVSGEKVGQVNGLAVLNLGDYVFGKPSKITARVFPGRSGVVNIERETEMSGRIHSKGVMILSGYLGGRYAEAAPLGLAASLCFEQLYEEIEGDSASSAELYALISAIAGVPLKQSVAVTGSVNQFGEIQPVGGVTYKVEGFYQVCKLKGLDGNQGVVIPSSNVSNLMLKDEVVQAVKEGAFNVWAVDTVDQALELLTGISADEVHARALRALKDMGERVKQHGWAQGKDH
ncbi:MAG TPA: AAA family ATPase [Firmicutes bacterium]|nr:AAA family ATPase [Bacillota bacterium]